MPLAPGRLSMTMGCDQAAVSFWPTARARMSVVPPAEKGTTIRTGLPGYCAAAENAASAADRTGKRLRRFIMGSPQERTLPAMIVLCKLRRMLRALAFLAACTLALEAGAQAFPAKPLRLVVGYPPGGSGDFLTRLIADEMSKDLGTAVIADNRPGAGGNIAAEMVARASADGYTVLNGNNHAIMAGSSGATRSFVRRRITGRRARASRAVSPASLGSGPARSIPDPRARASALKAPAVPSIPGLRNSKRLQSSSTRFSIGVPVSASRWRPRSSRAAFAEAVDGFLMAC